MKTFLCIFAALFAVCSAGLYGGGLGYNTGVSYGGKQWSAIPRASLRVIGGGYGGGYGAPVVGGYGLGGLGGLRVPGISNIGLAKTALNLPRPGIGPIPRAPAVLSTLSEPLVAHGLQYGGLPSVARSANAAAASSSVRSHAPVAIPAITVPRAIIGGHYGGGAY